MRILIFAALIGAALAACGQRGAPEIADPNRISQIQKGVSTKSDAQRLFGPPEGTEYADNGDETWDYI